jgi:hypothetical protein
MKLNGIKLLFITLLAGQLTYATECFLFEQQGSPESIPLHGHDDKMNYQTWCYHQLSSEELLVFNFNERKIKTETSAVIEVKNGKIQSILHGNLLKGKRFSTLQEKFYLNPFNVPLKLKEAKAKSISKVQLNNIFTENFIRQRDDLKSKLLSMQQKNISALDFNIFTVEDEKAAIPTERLPQDGYWWPHSGVPLARPENSPLHLYDQYVEKVFGRSPQSREWELRYHSLEHVPWGGHCNGWAASSVLDNFNEDYLYDHHNHNMISPKDIQGMRSETAFCVNWAFYGKRYRGNEGDDINDIYPDKFHKVLRYYIKGMGKPVALDRYQSTSVDNSVISGYDFKVEEVNPNRVKVTNAVRVHYYSGSYVYTKKTAYSRIKTYKYFLDLNDEGEITGGEWITSHPDFLWVPLAQEKCGRENPRMHHGWIDQMIHRLGHYQKAQTAINHEYNNTELAAQQTIMTDLEDSAETIKRGLSVNRNGVDTSSLKLLVKGVNLEGRTVTLEFDGSTNFAAINELKKVLQFGLKNLSNSAVNISGYQVRQLEVFQKVN